ncbi:FAD-dependent oxidoreductase [Candidatus Reidiella endopervernicosa]|uniref:malate dehydrogenase (quinone) n=1 Tax=Candidatus Reidiella endopervernicosa TaxID=2738883 RepID=A0A6N0HR73_9GAMM|nr:FAD-dependent oxidoreductase [Candidatus Reidiella endopervernicosa]QKQ24845.1 malate:quinone oxidoreductase [Candidatus Reidiella endopervernicosa]
MAVSVERFHPHYPDMELLDTDAIATREPSVTAGRRGQVMAISIANEYTAVNSHKLARSFEQQVRVLRPDYEIQLGCSVRAIHQGEHGFRIDSDNGSLLARVVVVSAGGHSLLFAKRMGYGKHYACLPVAGSFYHTPKLLNGKVYTIQSEKLPFAAVHGDPDLLEPEMTRFGPTALVLPLLERHNWRTLADLLRVTQPDLPVLKVLFTLLGEAEIRRYMMRNILFELPGIGKRLFLDDARKIIPLLQVEQLTFAKRVGGIRPVMIDKQALKLHLGEAQINPGTGIIFNMTPSPGATSCLGNAAKDFATIQELMA